MPGRPDACYFYGTTGVISAIATSMPPLKNVNLAPLWLEIRRLFAEQHFLTIVCAFVIVLMTIQFYRFIRSISPVLVPLFLLLVVFILVLHWTQTRTEPALFKPAVDWLLRSAPFLVTH